MRADLDTLVIALYCAACALFPAERTPRRGRPELISDNELVALMVAQMLLQSPSDRVFLRRARRRLGHLFPTCPRSRATTSAAARSRRSSCCFGSRSRPKRSAPATSCGCSTRRRSPAASRSRRPAAAKLAPWAGFGYCPAHSRRYWGFKLVLLCAPDGTICDFDLVAAHSPEREAALALLRANPIDGATIICDKGFAGADFEAAVTELRGAAPAAQPQPTSPIGPTHRSAGSANGSNRSSTRSKTNSCSNSTAPAPQAGLLTRITARILALCACINLNQRLGLTSRSLAAYAD